MTRRFCSKIPRRDEPGTYYTNIYPSTMPVRMCVKLDEPIYEIEVTETNKPTDESYYAWKNLEGAISMIYYGIFILNICFPYGYRSEEEAGYGKVIRVNIEEIREVYK